MSNRKNIFLIGPSGAGKSTIGKLLAKELKLEFYDSDQEIVKRAGADIPWIFDLEGERGFRLREEQVIAELTALSNIVLATGGGAVLSSANRAALSSRGNVVYLQVSLQQQQARVGQNQDRPLLQSADPLETLESMRESRGPLYTQLADVAIMTDRSSIRAVVDDILTKLSVSSS